MAALESALLQVTTPIEARLFGKNNVSIRISFDHQIRIEPREYVAPHMLDIRRTRRRMTFATVNKQSRVLLLDIERSKKQLVAGVVKLIHVGMD